MILVIGKDKDVTHTLAEQIVRELGHACECVQTLEEAKKTDLRALELIVAFEPFAAKNETPVLQLEPEKRPFRLQKLLAEIESALTPQAQDQVAIGKEYAFSPRHKTLRHAESGRQTALTDKEAALLLALQKAGKAGLSKEALLKEIWGFEPDLNTHTLETHIYRLRAKCNLTSR